MTDIITAVRGFKDILPKETGKWQFVEDKARRIFATFGFSEIRVPVVEKTDLFRRGIGETTDIVEKEMYTFLDRGDEYLTLRPEATASVIRAYIEHSLYAADPIAKLFTIGPMFRRERPQKGRYRQFHQIDVEILGIEDPRIDAEVMLMLMSFLEGVGLTEPRLEINSLGCPECRITFRKAITVFMEGKEGGLCDDCRRRLHSNPLRIFDCKVDSCRTIITDAPALIDFICEPCRDHFEKVREGLLVFDVPFKVNPRMVRGLDYYTKTTFEMTTEQLGAQNAIAGGGRYDGLVRDLGGPDIPGIGFAIGFERLIALLPSGEDAYLTHPDLFIAALGEEAQRTAFEWCNRLRLEGIQTEMDYSGKSLKSQMKRADKLGCRYTMIVGDREIQERKAVLRDMRESKQASVSLDTMEYLKNIIKGEETLV